MNMYVIYRPTVADHPGFWVVRSWHLLPGQYEFVPSPDCTLKGSLDEAREVIPSGLHRVDRMRSDDPCIEEVWL